MRKIKMTPQLLECNAIKIKRQKIQEKIEKTHVRQEVLSLSKGMHSSTFYSQMLHLAGKGCQTPSCFQLSM